MEKKRFFQLFAKNLFFAFLGIVLLAGLLFLVAGLIKLVAYNEVIGVFTSFGIAILGLITAITVEQFSRGVKP